MSSITFPSTAISPNTILSNTPEAYTETENPSEEESTDTKLSKIYSIDFNRPPLGANHHQFFAIRDQVIAIEEFCLAHAGVNTSDVRLKVQKLLLLQDYEHKMCELGLILFYLDKNHHMPLCDSLMEDHAAEIVDEIESYLTIHRQLCNNPQIPSGKTHYLLRTFAHMVFTSSQFYNRGGLIAIKHLLLNPAYLISKYVQPDHRDHILTICNHLLGSTAFDSLCKKQLIPHTDLQDLVRIDLKLCPQAKIESVLAWYSCMIALFSDVRQKMIPNCTIIASLICMSDNDTYKTLVQLIQWLQRGYCIIQGIHVPVAPLVANRLLCSEDLDISLNCSDALSLEPFTHIVQALAVTRPALDKGVIPLQETLSALLESNNLAHYLPYAQKLLYTFKYNALIDMQVAIYEFLALNVNSVDTTQYSYKKNKLLDACIHSLKKPLGGCVPDLFFETLKTNLGKKIWLVAEDSQSAGNGTQAFPFFEGDIEALKEVMQESVRVFSLTSNTFILVPTISELQKIIRHAIEETAKTFQTNAYKKEWIVKGCLRVLHLKQFRNNISNFIAWQINRSKIKGIYLNQADCLTLLQNGENGREILRLFLRHSLGHKLIECKSPYQFLEKLFDILNSNDSFFDINGTQSSKIMVRSNSHAWTLTPSFWKLILDPSQDVKLFVQNTFFRPGRRKLHMRISHSVKERIIRRVAKDNHCQENALISLFRDKKNISYQEFRDLIIRHTPQQSLPELRAIIEEEFSKTTISKKELGCVLTTLNIQDQTLVNKFFSQFPQSPSLPCHFALQLRTLLMNERICIMHAYEIELAICDVKSLPKPVYLGDLNHSDEFVVEMDHVYLFLVHSWFQGISYCTRSASSYVIKPHYKYSYVEFVYPKTLPPTQVI